MILMKHCVIIEKAMMNPRQNAKLNLFVSYNLKLYKLKGSIKKKYYNRSFVRKGGGVGSQLFLYGGGGGWMEGRGF